MQDRQNARLMGAAPTGNGRRQSYAHIPMPRMTNTIMLGGEADPSEVVASVRDGIYAVNFGGGQVDITNGKFVFSCTEAYRVRNGKILHPVKGATLIGDGPSALQRIRAVGNDMAMDPGIGTCGKNGQGVPATGNGRRQSYAHAPMPRMTNTIMLGGDADPADVLAGLKDGIYAVGFGGGQVDITNGKFVFSCTEAYRVKNGVVGAPVKGATLIGDGATALKQIRAIGNDMALDPGMGNCGKGGQWVPVGVGQPTLLIGGLTVGGSAA
jgi:predicted Zn-dependent protease